MSENLTKIKNYIRFQCKDINSSDDIDHKEARIDELQSIETLVDFLIQKENGEFNE